jgi:4-hydroxy-tetrahydrodipicolinate synthase
MRTELRGTGVALVTPFTATGEVDYDGLTRLIDHVINGGVEYVVSLGTTGESATLTKEEKKAVLSHTKAAVAQRVSIVAGFGGNDTRAVINDIEGADLTGVTAILSVSPYYNKPTQEGIYRHYKALAEASSLPIILYNVPGRTASNISADTTLRLAHDFEKIIGIKEASGNLGQCMDIVAGRPEGFLVISGEDELTLPMISFGMDGVISVVANAWPSMYSDMVRDALGGRFESASALHYRLLKVIRLLFAEGNPGGVKCALRELGICGDYVRLPLANVSSKTAEALKREITSMTVTSA